MKRLTEQATLITVINTMVVTVVIPRDSSMNVNVSYMFMLCTSHHVGV